MAREMEGGEGKKKLCKLKEKTLVVTGGKGWREEPEGKRME